MSSIRNRYFSRTDYGIIKFNEDMHKTQFINEHLKLKEKYNSDPFLNSILKEISIISHDYTKNLISDNHKIHIIANMNNKYIYPSLVSMNSVLKNSNKNRTTIVYHILCPEDLRRKNLNKLKSFLLIYPTNLEIIFYNMGNLFHRFKRKRFTEVAFYRLLAPIFIPIDKIIYLDSDVLVFEDLEEMYQLPFNDNYVLGFLDPLSDGVDYLGIISEKYINSGVLLINLDLIRKTKKYFDILYMVQYNKKLENNDQTIINYVFYPNIGLLPLKYGIFNFESIFDIKYMFLKKIRTNLNESEFIEAFKYPAIMHYILCHPKVWYSNSYFIKKHTRIGNIYRSSCIKYHHIWIEYAKNTSFYKEIKYFYKHK